VPPGALKPNDALVSPIDGRIVVLDGTTAAYKGTFASRGAPQAMTFAPDRNWNSKEGEIS
jgi:hypothetical protein